MGYLDSVKKQRLSTSERKDKLEELNFFKNQFVDLGEKLIKRNAPSEETIKKLQDSVDTLAKSIDESDLKDTLESVGNKLGSLKLPDFPKFPEIPAPIVNIPEAKAPIINIKEPEVVANKTMLELLKAVKAQKPVVIPKFPEFPEFPEIPKTDLSKVEEILDESKKYLKSISVKRFGGGGGGSISVSPYMDSRGEHRNVFLVNGAIPTTDVSMATILDDSSDPIIYIGKAPVGSATSAAVWQIAKLDTSSGLIKTWADGSSLFNQIWEDRAVLTYQ